MGFIKYSLSLMMIALFSLALITFAINFAVDNRTNVSLGDDAEYTIIKGALESDIEEFYEGTNTASESFAKSTVSSQTESTEGGTQFKVTPWTSISKAKNSVTAGWNKLFGNDPNFNIIFTALISALGFVMIMYAYKTWVGRNPD